MEAKPSEFEPVPMDSEDDFFIVYTSGTTNKPRRIVHSQAGYLLYTAFTHKVCNLHQDTTSLVPRPIRKIREKGLVSTVRACA